MKKKAFRLVSWIMTIAMCFAICSPGFAVAPDVNTEITKEIRSALGDEFMQKMAEQERAVEAYHYFCEYYEKNNDDTFVDNYGGEYIQDDKLYIFYIDTAASFAKVLEKYEDVVVFEKVKYSFGFLYELYEMMYTAIPEKGRIRYEISTKDNCIIVSGDKTALEEYQDAIEQFAGDNNAPGIVSFQEVDNVRATTTTTPLYGGTPLYIQGDSRVNRTISVCGTSQGHFAFATCGHNNAVQATQLGGTSFFTEQNGTTAVGTTYIVAYANNGYGDFSIVRINTDLYNTTNLIKHYIGNYVECAGGDTYYASGQYLIKYGAVGEWAGLRVGNHHGDVRYYLDPENASSPSWNIKGLKTTDVEVGTSVGGDSGGPILRYDSDTGEYYYCGVVSGRTTEEDVVTKVYFSPYSLMDDDLIF